MESPSRWLKATVLLLVVANLIVMGINAGTASICEDESNGYFLSRRPLPELVEALANNAHEDPPLYDLLLHGWIGVFDYNLLGLRSLSMLMWCLTLPGLFLAARRLDGDRTAWIAVGIACLLPTHWLLPASIRWYSLFSCLCIWNFYFFLGIHSPTKREAPDRNFARFAWRELIPYALTGAGLWYTNYAAPVLFFSHLVVTLIGSSERRRVVVNLVLGWSMISVLYLPWLPTFLSQMGVSVHKFSPINTALTLWVMTAGEFCTPLNPWMAGSVLLAGLALLALVLRNLRRCWIPPLIIGVVLAVMISSGVIRSRRVMFLVPMLALTIALALQSGQTTSRWLAAARKGLIAAGMAAVVLSFGQMVRRDNWVTCRWLDPLETAVQRVKQQDPEALVLTNSNPALFYLRDEFGKGVFSKPPQGDFRFTGLYFPFTDHLLPHYQPKLNSGQSAVYLHHWAYGGPLSGVYDDLVQEMAGYGYKPERMEAYLAMPDEYVKNHPHFAGMNVGWADSYRVVLLYFTKPAPEPPSSEAIAVASRDQRHASQTAVAAELR